MAERLTQVGTPVALRTKSIDALIAASEEPGKRLAKTLGPWSLTALGIGAVIGSGIFILTGTAAAGEKLSYDSILHAPVLDLLMHGRAAVSTIGRPGAGPAISLSFLLTALACSFAALCYAELASMIPIAGSAYTYAYATLGEIFAWIIGWDLILEYAVSNMAVAVGFSAYLNDFLEAAFGVHLPAKLSGPMIAGGRFTGAWFNVPTLLLLLALSYILARGIKESAGTNNVMVLVKIAAILIFVIGAARAVRVENWRPFMPNGFSGVLTGAAHYSTLNNAAPVAGALKALGYDGIRRWVELGALVGMLSSLLVFQYGQARVWFAMSRDGLLPRAFSRVHPVHRTPHVSTWVAGLVVGIPAGIWDIGTFADLSNIGTLFAFIVVSAGVIVLRRTQPERPRGFRVPGAPALPLLSIVSCLVLMLSLPLETWVRFFVWLIVGLAIYYFFGRKHSELRAQAASGI